MTSLGLEHQPQEAIFCVFLLKKLDEFRTFRALDWLSRVVV